MAEVAGSGPPRDIPATFARDIPAHHQDQSLGLLLSLKPSYLERQFWRSTAGRSYLRSLDQRVFWLVLVKSVAVAFNEPSGPPHALLAAYLCAALHIAIISAQVLAAHRPNYNRVPYVAALRASHLLQAALHTATLSPAPRIPFLLHSTRRTPTPLPWPLRTPVLLAAALLPVLHSLQLPLTFRLALPIQLLYLLAILTACTAPAAHILRLPSFSPAVTPLCYAIDALSGYTMALITGVPPPRAPPCTTAAAPWLVALFLQTAAGVVLPLAFCYVLEYRAKAAFLARGVRQAGGELPAPVLVLRGALLLVGVSVVAWEGLLLTHARLPRWALVTSGEACEDAWFGGAAQYEGLVGGASHWGLV